MILPAIAMGQDPGRHLDRSKIVELSKEEAFNYNRGEMETPGFIERFLQALGDALSAMTGSQEVGGFLEVILYIVAFILMMYAIIKILGINIRGIVYREQANEPLIFGLSEEIEQINFESRIKEGQAKGDLSEVVRLYYLWSLQILNARNIINWKSGKTNHEYQNEITNSSLLKAFQSLTYYFEYSFYGHFEVGQNMVQSTETAFSSLRKEVGE